MKMAWRWVASQNCARSHASVFILLLRHSILRAPIAFFDVTPIGRVLNRFAADMDKVDLELVQSLQQGLSMLFSILGAVSAIIAATKGAFLIPMIPLGYVYYLIQGWFRKTSTELQRLVSAKVLCYVLGFFTWIYC